MKNQGSINGRQFNMFTRNLNTRALEISEERYAKKLACLSEQNSQRAKVVKECLEEQYMLYCKTKKLNKSDERRVRRIERLGLLGDKFSLLSIEGLNSVDYGYTYVLDLSEHLDLAMSMMRNSDHFSICERNTDNLCERFNISKWELSKHILSQNLIRGILDKNLTLRDLLGISPLFKEYFECALAKAFDEELDIFQCLGICSYNDLDGIEDGGEFVTALSLRILKDVESVILDLLYLIKDECTANNANFLVLSKFIPGFVFTTNKPVRDFYIPIKNAYIKAPLRLVN